MEGKMLRRTLAVCGLLLVGAAPLAHAARITVGTLDDVSNSQCTLRDAITAATNNATAGACPAGDADNAAEDEIVFDPALFPAGAQKTLALSSQLPPLNGFIAIKGPGAQTLTVRRADDAPLFRILTVDKIGSRLRLSDIRLANGAVVDDHGGGIFSWGDLELTRCTIENNQAIRSAKPGTVVAMRPSGGGIHFRGSVLTITDSRIANNRVAASSQSPTDDGGGGGIYQRDGTLVMRGSTVVGNSTSAGGGGISGQSMTIENSEIAFNRASSGGGIFASGMPQIRTSAIHDNTATEEGGGLIVYGSDIRLERLSVYANHAGGSGGGILTRTSDKDQFQLVNSTLYGNSAGMGGGGIGIGSQSSFDKLVLIHNTIAGNSANTGGGLDLFVPEGYLQNGLTLAANIIAGNHANASPDMDAYINGSPVRNLFSNSSGIGNFQSGDLVTDARLGPLLDDGLARVQTVLAASPAVNAVDCYQVSVDQTGGPRPLDGKCEIGAHEFRGNLEQSLRFDAPRDRLLSEGAFQAALAATRPLGTDAGGQLTLATLTPQICTVSGRMVTPRAIGLCTLEASLPAGSGGAGLPRLAVQRSFLISEVSIRTAQVIEFPALADRVASDPPQTLKAVASSGLAVRYTAQGPCSIVSGAVAAGGASGTGVCTVTATQEGNTSYASAAPATRSFTVFANGSTAPIIVTTLNDESATHCTLRDAIRSANDNTARGACTAGDPNGLVTDEITFDTNLFDGTPQQIRLGTALPALRDHVILTGPGADLLELRRDFGYGTAQQRFRILTVASGATATVSGLSLSGGVVGDTPSRLGPSGRTDSDYGGGIRNDGTLTLRRCIVKDNKAYAGFIPTGNRQGYSTPTSGGGIYSRGELVIEDCEISGNQTVIGDGGGIHAVGPLTLRNSLIDNNNAVGRLNKVPVMTQDSKGGGIRSDGLLTVVNSTVTGNRVNGYGGGIASFGTVNLQHATISGNRFYEVRALVGGGGGVHAPGGGTVTNSVIAGNFKGDTSIPANLSGNLTSSGTNRIDGDAQLGMLAANGGPTRTLLPQPASPVIDAASCLPGIVLDQRGQPRPGLNSAGSRCDIGAVEVQKGGASSRAPQSIDFPAVGARTPGAAFPLEASASSGLPISFTAQPAGICTVTGKVLTPLAVGSCTVTANQAGNTEFEAASAVPRSFNIQPPVLLEQIIAFTTGVPASATVGDTYEVAATGGASGNPVTFSIGPEAAAICTLVPNSHAVSFTAAGLCIINADQAGNASYAAAPQVQQNVPVAPIPRPAPPQLTAISNGTLTGTAAPQSTVEVFDGIMSLGSTTADPSGHFSLTHTLSTGPHSLTATASNGGGTSGASAPLTLDVPLFDGPVSGGKADRVRITSDINGCKLQDAAPRWLQAPGPLPAHATAPLGALAFTVLECPAGTLTVQVDYPADSLAGLTAYKHGPGGWFAHGSTHANGDSVTYTVADDDAGDSDPTPGVIEDPHAMLHLVAPPAALQPVPTLSTWSLGLLGVLASLLGAGRVRRAGFKVAASDRRCT
ncbi:IPTL-CTERM sorting domain-containing protein [Ottowia sp. VDI28]|uniref:IPTL-CTERM sorting domain-containing protein n=1 Tax=Ottowia sp. VDI28 TaxID=3133968 RepID=UPI003C2AC1D8